MKRYFYTNPLAAAWMASTFGMKLYSAGDGEETAKTITDDYACGVAADRYYVHTDSEKMLEPQDGDLVDGEYSEYYDEGINFTRSGAFTYSKYDTNDPSTEVETIIERNGLAFMWPESEEA